MPPQLLQRHEALATVLPLDCQLLADLLDVQRTHRLFARLSRLQSGKTHCRVLSEARLPASYAFVYNKSCRLSNWPIEQCRIHTLRRRTARVSLRPEQKHWNADVMLNSARSRAQEQVSEEAVTVGAHRHQIATLSLDPVDNFGYRVPISQFDLHRNSGGAKFLADLRQVCGVLR